MSRACLDHDTVLCALCEDFDSSRQCESCETWLCESCAIVIERDGQHEFCEHCAPQPSEPVGT